MIGTWTTCSTDGTPPPYFSRPQPETVAIRPVKSAVSGGMQIGTETEEFELIRGPLKWDRNLTNVRVKVHRALQFQKC